MKKEGIVSVILLSVLIIALVIVDVIYNPSYYSFSLEKKSSDNIDNQSVIILENNVKNNNSSDEVKEISELNTNSQEVTSKSTLTNSILLESEIDNSRIEDVKVGKDLFDIKLEDLLGIIKKRYIYSGDFPLSIVYEVDSSIEYEDLKKYLFDKVKNSPVYTINETNSFGKRSLYLNNNNRKEINFTLIEFESLIVGFEYPRDNHLKLQKLFEYLKYNL